ncbi:Maf family protein [Paeniglutamicibacter cryotolerans]|uniref:Nucleoside triphosphate pyrophosphatase n=1 Tax=Paeniglutamicibacter cryotolerans TaxID=670079 RepID=A0A839QIK2_9MICC|nr:nucleoside triphosphate pyrophosphatase [Paeniglutamicibacter cryotolerans]MBB2996019.1 septum formation protein [Paeniglutamicibacter cryotolerans]
MSESNAPVSPEDLPLLVLASASPGRAKILREAGIDFQVIVSAVDEDAELAAATARFGTLDPSTTALLLAKAKAEAVAAQEDADGAVVLGCDSVFEFEGAAYGKPHTAAVAAGRWAAMRGKSGILHTGHWLIDNRSEEGQDGGSGATIGEVSSAIVHFAKVTDEEIEAYVASGEPLPCAGGFTIDGLGSAFITSIEGNPHTVVGLNVSTLRELLGSANLTIMDLWA